MIAEGVARDVLLIRAPWILSHIVLVDTYNQPPKSLEELKSDVDIWRAGTDVHHIVERVSGFSREVIDSPDNLVRIPRMKHHEINGWYQEPNPDFGWQSPREYLIGRSWSVRYAVGLDALRRFGVLKP
jgi:hypothetical protein